ncbi:MAG: hypothetical protein ABSC64_15945 [Candidatus Korobacteraceae bacterium]
MSDARALILPLLFLLRNARSLHPHTRKAAPDRRQRSLAATVEPKEELVGWGTKNISGLHIRRIGSAALT